ncbi:hypothetical protein NLG97_g2482 [Lecanicillium saksenae]|uniref:Uncharacterized protein n=1 Tax=Lecanicillium saksenae TaxID=468837 RepID=A0ACC1R3F2_9HYPO|nr:hypothetical protein NLG97_g2482 [Lecanicillium saksenae]
MSPKPGLQMPSVVKNFQLSYPYPTVLLVLINRPRQLNSLTTEANFELDRIIHAFDAEPSLRVAIVSGVGKAFCVGADIKEWISNNTNGIPFEYPDNGFGGLSFRRGRKPVIAAVNGPAHGGGCEMVLNCDLIIAAASATFALPEIKRGVIPMGGSLPRLMKTLGRQLASELALTGRCATAHEFKTYGLCNFVVPDGEDVVGKALEYAKIIADNSPDAVIAVREGLQLGWEGIGVEDAESRFITSWFKNIYEGENMREGLNAFLEKRDPRWKDSKL